MSIKPTPEATAYIALLLLPHGGVREKLQGAMSTLRNHIADTEKRDFEEVQNHYEYLARLLQQ